MLMTLKKNYLDNKYKDKVKNIIIMSAHFGSNKKTLVALVNINYLFLKKGLKYGNAPNHSRSWLQ